MSSHFGSPKVAGAISGLFLGCLGLFAGNIFIRKLSYYVVAGVPIAASALNFIVQVDLGPVLPAFDVLFAVCYSILLVRVIMSISRSLLISVPTDSNLDKQAIIFIAFVCFSLFGYMAYAHFHEGDWNGVSFVWVFWNLGNLALTIFTDHGSIHDYSCVLLASAASLLHDSAGAVPYDIITVLRTLFVTVTIISPLAVLPSAETEETFAFFAVKKKRTRIVLSMTMLSYLLVSPGAMWRRGDLCCPLLALLAPGIYSLFLANEEWGLSK
jgi:hypothetical protein